MPQTAHLVLVPTSAAGGEASTLAIAGESAHHAGVESGAIARIESANRIASTIGRFESFIFPLVLAGFVNCNPLPRDRKRYPRPIALRRSATTASYFRFSPLYS